MNKKAACMLLLMPPVASLCAAENEWQRELELGLVATDGNTDTRNITTKADFSKEHTQWRHNIHAEVLYSSSEGQSTAEKYLISNTNNYKFNEFDSMFFAANYEDDRFSGFDNQITLAAGYGRRLINDENTQTLDVEVGPGYRISKLEDGDSVDEAVLRLGGKYFLSLSENSDFQQSLLADIGEDTTITKSISSLKAQINGRLAMKMSLTLKHTSDVPDDVDNTDAETSITLVYGF